MAGVGLLHTIETFIAYWKKVLKEQAWASNLALDSRNTQAHNLRSPFYKFKQKKQLTQNVWVGFFIFTKGFFMSTLNFNVEEHLKEAPLPNLANELWVNGKVPVIIREAVHGESKSNGDPYLRFQIEALDGENKGRRRSIFVMQKHANPAVVDMGKRTLAHLCKATGIANLTNLDQLQYQKVIVTVGRRLNKKTNEVENSFGYFEPYRELQNNDISAYGKVKEGAHVVGYKPSIDASKPLEDDAIPF